MEITDKTHAKDMTQVNIIMAIRIIEVSTVEGNRNLIKTKCLL